MITDYDIQRLWDQSGLPDGYSSILVILTVLEEIYIGYYTSFVENRLFN